MEPSAELNPYEAPKTHAPSTTPWDELDEAPFYTATATKFTVLSLCSFGLYGIYWFYRNWSLHRRNTGADVIPGLRAFFAPLFAYSMFNIIQDAAKEHEVEESLSPAALAIAYFGLSMTWKLPGALSLISDFTFLPLLAANNVARAVNAKAAPSVPENSAFSGWAIAVTVFGGLLLLAATIGTLMP